MAVLTLNDNTSEKCPSCGWGFKSQPCCDLPAHNQGAICPRCSNVFLSAASLPVVTVKPPQPARRHKEKPRHHPSPGLLLAPTGRNRPRGERDLLEAVLG